MIGFVLGLFEIAFVIVMLLLLSFFIASLLLAWAWGQRQSLDETGKNMTFSEILTIAGIEWGAFVTLLPCQWSALKVHWESPKFDAKNPVDKPRPTQNPILFVPSLHLGSGIFRILFWRLKSHYFQSLWPLSWKSFLFQAPLLEDQLARTIDDCFEKTGATQMTLISFGSSRPIVSRTLDRPAFRSKQIRWICLSGPATKPEVYKFVSTSRLKMAFQDPQPIEPDVLIVGERDTICYPPSVFGEPHLVIPDVGHYGSLLHSATVQRILEELDARSARKSLPSS